MGTHWEGFSINPREGYFLRANIFLDQMRPLASPRRGQIPKRWAIAGLRTVEHRGSAHPPGEPPGRRDPERPSTLGTLSRDNRPHTGPAARIAAVYRLPAGGRARSPGTGTARGSPCKLPALAATRLGRASCPLAPHLPPFDLSPVNPARPIHASGFRRKRAAHAARPIHDPKPVSGDHHRRRTCHAGPDEARLV